MKKFDRRNGTAASPTSQYPPAVALARLAAGLTQQKLAGRLGISQSYMSEIERGTRSVSADCLAQIARECKCEVETLLNPVLKSRALTPRARARARAGTPAGAAKTPAGKAA